MQQNVKSLIGAVNCGVGAVALWAAFSGKWLTKYAHSDTEVGVIKHRIHKAAFAALHVSMVLSAAVSPAGIWVLSRLANKVYSVALLANFCPKTLRADDAWHLRHVVNLLTVVLPMPIGFSALFVNVKEGREWYLTCIAAWLTITNNPVL